MVHPDDRPIPLDAWIQMLETGRAPPCRYRRAIKDGSYRLVEVTLVSHLDANNDGYVEMQLTDLGPDTTPEPDPADAWVSERVREPRHGIIRETATGQIIYWDRGM